MNRQERASRFCWKQYTGEKLKCREFTLFLFSNIGNIKNYDITDNFYVSHPRGKRNVQMALL
jgi:hypothetical protein